MMRIWVLLTLLGATPALAQTALDDLPALFDVTGVARDDVLNIRAHPDASSRIIHHLTPTASGVEVVDYSPDRKWAKINAAEGTAWVAARFLTRSDVSAWWEMSSPLTCYGTEPFWDLNLNPTSYSTLSTPDQSPIILSPGWLADTWGRPDWGTPITAAIALNSATDPGLAVIRAEYCDDGMSDREFGLSIAVFVGDHTRHIGCCSLAQP